MPKEERNAINSDEEGMFAQEHNLSEQSGAKHINIFQSFYKKSIQFKIKIGIISCAVLIALCGLLVWFLSRPIAKFESALAEGDYATAEAIYKQNMEDSRFLGSSERVVDNIVNDYLDSYKNNNISSNDAISEIEKLRSYAWGGSSDEEIQTIHTIEDSRVAYQNAQEALKDGNYADTLKNLALVNSEDLENYKNAQDQIKDVSEAYCGQAIDKASETLEQGDALSAISILEDVDESYRSKELVDLLASTFSQAQVQAIAEINDLLTAKDYKAAYLYIKDLPQNILNDEIITMKEEIISNLCRLASEKSSGGDYEAAIALLTDTQGNALELSFQEALVEYQRGRDTKALQSLGGFFTVRYDSIGKKYDIVPNGLSTTGIEIGYQRNIEPWIMISDEQTSFMLYFGFRQEDWIFMDEIIIDCDGTQFKLAVDFTDRMTDISGGTIAEANVYIDIGKEFGILLGRESRIVDFEPIVSAMGRANEVRIRFHGDGYKDVSIPKSQIEQLSGFWTAYQILLDDPSLVSALA